MTNVHPDWPVCEYCDVLKADSVLEEIKQDADDPTLNIVIQHPVCQQCAFDRGWAIRQRFVWWQRS